MSKNPNPQGKGQAPVLALLSENRDNAIAVPPKQVEQVSTELFTALFILQSDFRFQPTPGRPHWLYQKEGRFRLSLTPPESWHPKIAGRYIGECVLQADMTWTLALAEDVARDPEFQDMLAARREAFERELENARTLDEVLPVHRGELPFYQRAFAYALAHSLGRSMDQSGIRGLGYDEARGLLTHAAAESVD